MSPLQTQYPLSPRKFWKKLIEKLLVWVPIALVVAGCCLYFSYLASSSDTLVAQVSGGIALGAVALTIAGLLLYAWYVRVYIRRYYYDANENFVTIKKGVFAPTEIHVQYQKIQDVYVDQDILDRIMGLYDVHIASATVGSSMEAHIDGVEHEAAEGLKHLLLAKIQGHSGMPAGGAQAPMAPAGPVVLPEDISIKTYPINGRWTAQQVVSWFFLSALYTFFITLWLFAPDEDGSESFGNFLGLSWDGIWFWMFVATFGFHVVYTLLWKHTFSFVFLPEYIQMKSGVISRSEVHMPYRSVQDVQVSQGIIERLFGIATVKIQNAAQTPVAYGKTTVMQAGGVNIPGQTLDKAEHIAGIVRNITVTKNSSGTGL